MYLFIERERDRYISVCSLKAVDHRVPLADHLRHLAHLPPEAQVGLCREG